MQDNLSELEFTSAVEETLQDDIDYYKDKIAMPLENIVLNAALAVKAIKEKVTPTPSVRDIREYFEDRMDKAMQDGWLLEEISLVESHVTAAFGFTGDEWDDFEVEDEEDPVPCLYDDLMVDGEQEVYGSMGMSVFTNRHSEV